MNRTTLSTLLFCAALVPTTFAQAESIPVTAENFAKAETAWNMRNWDKLRSGPGLFHYRETTPTGV